MINSKIKNWEQGTAALASLSFIFSLASIKILLEVELGSIESLIVLVPVLLFILAILAGTIVHNIRWGLANTSLVFCAWGCSMGLIVFPGVLLYKLGVEGVSFIPYSICLGLLFFLMIKRLKKSSSIL